MHGTFRNHTNRIFSRTGYGVLGLVITWLAATAMPTLPAHDDSLPHQGKPPLHAQDSMRAFSEDHHHNEQLSAQAVTACESGFAGSYPCSNIDLMAFLPLAQIGGGNGNDIWGWTDSTTGREYAIMGLTNGTTFVDITDPVNPVFLGVLPLHTGVNGSSWRDIKVFNDYAFIGSEALGSGMQVMNLAQLRNVPSPPVTFTENGFYSGFSTSHNIVINGDTGFAYAVGANNCSGGLHFVDILTPTSPTGAGCYSADGYTHDAQCVVYHGPDTAHQGKEICFAFNEDTLTIVDVGDKSSPSLISRTGYTQSNYTHQGWLTEDHAYLLMDDELDESRLGGNTRTLMWDLADLDSPFYMGYHSGVSTAIDHNQYIKGNYVYQANYRSGLRILDISDLANGNLVEVGFFDVYPASDSANFNGAWSVYPFFDSGTVVVSGIEQGLFVLRPNLGPPSDPPQVSVVSPADGSTDLTGTIAVEIDASDTEDPAGTLNVEWNIDGGAWQGASYVGGQYVAQWDSASVLDGAHTLNARAVDSDLREGSDSSGFTVANGAPEFHIGSVNVGIVSGKGDRNHAEAVITVLDAGLAPLGGVLIDGSFNGGWSGSAGGTTGSDGQVRVTTPKVKGLNTAGFCVDAVSKAGWSFDAGSSTLCGDSNGGGGAFGSVNGRVSDSGSGAGIASAGVSTDTGQSDTTDVNGDYAIGSVPVGNRTVSVTANGYIGQNQEADVIESAVTTVDFTLNPTPSGGSGMVKGTIYDGSDGAKIADVLIEVAGGSSATSNKGGKYSLQNVAAGERQVTASRAGYLPQTRQVSVSAGLTITVDFTLVPE